MKYLNVKGRVGTTHVDLDLSLTLEDIITEMPGIIEMFRDKAPSILAAAQAAKEAMNDILAGREAQADKRYNKLRAS